MLRSSRASSRRKRQVIRGFVDGERQGTYWGIRSHAADYGPPAGSLLDSEPVHELGRAHAGRPDQRTGIQPTAIGRRDGLTVVIGQLRVQKDFHALAFEQLHRRFTKLFREGGHHCTGCFDEDDTDFL